MKAIIILLLLFAGIMLDRLYLWWVARNEVNGTNRNIDEKMGTKRKSKIKKAAEAISKGNIGSAIKIATEAAGIEQCEGCAKREVALNFGDKARAKRTVLEQGDYKELNKFFNTPPNNSENNKYRFESKQQFLALVAIHNKHYPEYTYKPDNCNPCRVKVINRLKLLYNS